MRYRVQFLLHDRKYYTEWFDTRTEAWGFIRAAAGGTDVFPLHIENENGTVV